MSSRDERLRDGVPLQKSDLMTSLFHRIPDCAWLVFDPVPQCCFAGGQLIGSIGLLSVDLEMQKPILTPHALLLCQRVLGGESLRVEEVIGERRYLVTGWPLSQAGMEVQGGMLFYLELKRLGKELDAESPPESVFRDALERMEQEKQEIQKRVTENIHQVLLPLLEKAKSSGGEVPLPPLIQIEKNLRDLTRSFGLKVEERFYRLTPKEIQVCSMIKKGYSSRDIGLHLDISEGTVESHRNHIRRKLDIAGKNINLTTYLRNFDGF